MSEVSDVELGKLIQQISTLEVMVKEQNVRLDKLDHQLERTRGNCMFNSSTYCESGKP